MLARNVRTRVRQRAFSSLPSLPTRSRATNGQASLVCCFGPSLFDLGIRCPLSSWPATSARVRKKEPSGQNTLAPCLAFSSLPLGFFFSTLDALQRGTTFSHSVRHCNRASGACRNRLTHCIRHRRSLRCVASAAPASMFSRLFGIDSSARACIASLLAGGLCTRAVSVLLLHAVHLPAAFFGEVVLSQFRSVSPDSRGDERGVIASFVAPPPTAQKRVCPLQSVCRIRVAAAWFAVKSAAFSTFNRDESGADCKGFPRNRPLGLFEAAAYYVLWSKGVHPGYKPKYTRCVRFSVRLCVMSVFFTPPRFFFNCAGDFGSYSIPLFVLPLCRRCLTALVKTF